MVWFWPWRHNDASPASFEKTLSALSNKITTTQRQLDRARSTGRRVKVLGTLYLGFAYLVYAIVLLLVVGWRNMGALEWSGLAGGPIVIYAVRTTVGAFYNFRTETLAARLKEQQGERTATIQKLKEATKYDSTLQLLEKYGGGTDGGSGKSNKGKKKGEDGEEDGPRKSATPSRTNMPPPPTANILRPNMIPLPRSRPGTPRSGPHEQSPMRQRSTSRHGEMEASAEFAPNAFGPGGPVPQPTYAPGPMAPSESHWYDRILDTLLGEDETAPRNRIVLLCERCRLVNGQAPPGTKSLSEIGTWKCMACGALNGEMDEGEKIVRDVLGQASKDGRVGGSVTTDDDGGGESSDLVDVDAEDIPDEPVVIKEEAEEADQPRRRKGKKKN